MVILASMFNASDTLLSASFSASFSDTFSLCLNILTLVSVSSPSFGSNWLGPAVSGLLLKYTTDG